MHILCSAYTIYIIQCSVFNSISKASTAYRKFVSGSPSHKGETCVGTNNYVENIVEN